MEIRQTKQGRLETPISIITSCFSFATAIEKLKFIERVKNQFFWCDYPELARYESVADHSWRVYMPM